MKPQNVIQAASMKDVQPLLQKIIKPAKKRKYSASAISTARSRA
jgi:hypothetical protein